MSSNARDEREPECRIAEILQFVCEIEDDSRMHCYPIARIFKMWVFVFSRENPTLTDHSCSGCATEITQVDLATGIIYLFIYHKIFI
jgi:hypothetical protein